VPGDDREGCAVAPVGDGDPRVRERAEDGRDAWHDLEGNAGLHTGRGLLATPAEDVGVAPLETHDGLALGGQAQEQRRGLGLRNRGRFVTALAHVEALCLGGHQVEQLV
jgi:hypothetical protein